MTTFELTIGLEIVAIVVFYGLVIRWFVRRRRRRGPRIPIPHYEGRPTRGPVVRLQERRRREEAVATERRQPSSRRQPNPESKP